MRFRARTRYTRRGMRRTPPTHLYRYLLAWWHTDAWTGERTRGRWYTPSRTQAGKWLAQHTWSSGVTLHDRWTGRTLVNRPPLAQEHSR